MEHDGQSVSLFCNDANSSWTQLLQVYLLGNAGVFLHFRPCEVLCLVDEGLSIFQTVDVNFYTFRQVLNARNRCSQKIHKGSIGDVMGSSFALELIQGDLFGN